jgi:WD40 repeat protein
VGVVSRSTLVSAIATEFDGITILVGSEGIVEFFDLRMLRDGSLLPEPGYCTFSAGCEINAIVDLKNGSFACCDDDGSVFVFNIAMGSILPIASHENVATCLEVVEDGLEGDDSNFALLVSGGMDAVISMHHLGFDEKTSSDVDVTCHWTTSCLDSETRLEHNPPFVYDLAVSSDRSTIAAALGSGAVRVFSFDDVFEISSDNLLVFDLVNHNSIVSSIVFSNTRADSVMFSGGCDKMLNLWDISADDPEIPRTSARTEGKINRLLCLAQDKLIVADTSNDVSLWEVKE